MAEKVREGVDGFHFTVGSSIELQALLLRLHNDPAALARVKTSMRGATSTFGRTGRSHRPL